MDNENIKKLIRENFVWCQCFRKESRYEEVVEKLANDISNLVEAPVKPACGHKRTAKQFFIEQYQEGKCEDITTNPYPEFNNAFYLNIYKLMEDYSKSV